VASRLGGNAFAHPAFDVYRRWLPQGALPSLQQLNAWVGARAPASGIKPLQFVADSASSAIEYETRIAVQREVAMRPDNLHDVCNALAWLAFPRTKAALNALHVHDPEVGNGRRSARRDAATLLDESGLLLACADRRLTALLEQRAWRELFVTHREDVNTSLRAVVCGHGLLAKMVAPFRAITGRALVIPVTHDGVPREARDWTRIDARAARQVGSPRFTTAALLPLPVAGLPGWDAEGLGATLFDDGSVFRPRVLR
jgi:hypothetical protein